MWELRECSKIGHVTSYLRSESSYCSASSISHQSLVSAVRIISDLESMKIEFRCRVGSAASYSVLGRLNNIPLIHKFSFSFNRPTCSRKENPNPQSNSDGKGDKSSQDWDKAWKNFKKQGKKSLFSSFSPDKYVSWSPKRSEYPLSEEVDPIKRTERSNLVLWTSSSFTLGGAIVIVSLLLIYTLLAPVK